LKIYIVQKGDTASKIAEKHGVSLSALKSLNTQLSDPEKLKPGMKIKVPTESKPVLRNPKVVKKETVEQVTLTEDKNQAAEETSIEESSTIQAFSGNTYTYKIPHDPGTLYPFNEGEEGTIPNLDGSNIPMMDDPFPNSIKEKEEKNPTPYYAHPAQGAYPNVTPYPNPAQGTYPNITPYPNPYYPSTAPTYYSNPPYPTSNVGQMGGYVGPHRTYEGSQEGPGYQNNGFYGYAPLAYPPGVSPNPLGCRAVGPYSDYYSQGTAYEISNESEAGFSYEEQPENQSTEREMTTPSYSMPGQGEPQGAYPYPFTNLTQQGWQSEPQGANPNPYPYTSTTEQGVQREPQGANPNPYPYTSTTEQGVQREPQGANPNPYPYTSTMEQDVELQGANPNPYPYTSTTEQGVQREPQGTYSYPYMPPTQQGWQGESQGTYSYSYASPTQQGVQGELQGAYPYSYANPTEQGVHGGAQGASPYPYTGSTQQGGQEPFGTAPTYPPAPYYPTAPKAPDYSLWESYVDYHQPPYQPDFPVKTQKE
jgi:spore coat assembly protein SafA